MGVARHGRLDWEVCHNDTTLDFHGDKVKSFGTTIHVKAHKPTFPENFPSSQGSGSIQGYKSAIVVEKLFGDCFGITMSSLQIGPRTWKKVSPRTTQQIVPGILQAVPGILKIFPAESVNSSRDFVNGS